MTEKEKEELRQAVDYFEGHGFIEELTSDKRAYVQILINHAKKVKYKTPIMHISKNVTKLPYSLDGATRYEVDKHPDTPKRYWGYIIVSPIFEWEEQEGDEAERRKLYDSK